MEDIVTFISAVRLWTNTHSCFVCRSLTPSHRLDCFPRHVWLVVAAVSLVSLSPQRRASSPLLGTVSNNAPRRQIIISFLCVRWLVHVADRRLSTVASSPSEEVNYTAFRPPLPPRHSCWSQWRSRRLLIKGGLAALRSGVCDGSSSGGKQTSCCLSF